jgi:hypothetical protein
MPIPVATWSKTWTHSLCCVLSGRGLCIVQSLVQRSATDYCVSECDLKTFTRRRPRATRAVKPLRRRGRGEKKNPAVLFNNIHSKDHPFS